jgi:excinuclease UvrABC nuclease subunit
VTTSDPSDDLAVWSPWLPFDQAAVEAPRLPGVYMARDHAQVVYVGMAAGRRGQGIRARLTVYRRVMDTRRAIKVLLRP